MKKRKVFLSFYSICRILFLLLVLSTSVILISGCTSVPGKAAVQPVQMLDRDCNLFVCIPVKRNEQVVKEIVMANFNGSSNQNDSEQALNENDSKPKKVHLEENDIDSILKHLRKVYIGLPKEGAFQIAAETDIPSAYLNAVLTPKKGWKKQNYKVPDTKQTVQYHSNDFCSIYMPFSGVICVSDKMPSMINNYLSADFSVANLIEPDTDLFSTWLNSTDKDVTFYTDNSKEFLKKFLGIKLDLKVSYIKGVLSLESKKINLHLSFENDKYLKAAKSMLTMFFGSASFEDFEITENELIIKEYELKTESINSIFTSTNFGGN